MPCEQCDTTGKEYLEEIIARCGAAPESALPLLQAIQARWRYLPPSILRHVSEHTQISAAQLYGVATFYPHFRLRPAGEHMIRVCHGTACHVVGAERVTDALRRKLKITDPAEDTSPDGEFTVERVACLGCCTMAPVMLVDETPYGRLDATKSVEALESFQRGGAPAGERRAINAALADNPVVEIRVGLNSCCLASGGREVWDALRAAANAAGVPYSIKPVGCTGICHRAPLIEFVRASGAASIIYGGGNPRDAIRMIHREIPARGLVRKVSRALERAADYLANRGAAGEVGKKALGSGDKTSAEFLAAQVRIVTEGSGALDPLSVDDYIASGGYEALRKCLASHSPERVIEMIQESGLRGRGGAGFPSGVKWRLVREAAGAKKYAICNGDEGDPGAFMDRMLLESFPHRILEGLAIAAYAAGADEAIFYIRTEYSLALFRVREAIRHAEERGFLGNSILGSKFSLRVSVSEGAGAFVCGEESALIASIEGQRGMPRFRPPYPAQKGLHGCPTLVNNVETLGNVPWILRNGPAAFAAIGTARSKGAKVFALAGKVRRGGLIEVPMGIPLDKVVHEIGGGVKDGRTFKAVQLGGPSGGCIPAGLSGVTLDYESVPAAGAILGSGGLVVLDNEDCTVDIARYFLDFTQKESCGRCTFCRVGTKRMLEILERLCEGKAVAKDLDDLEELAHRIKQTSLCGLGRTAPNPVLSTLRYFRDEYEAHLKGVCPAGKCKELIRYEANEKCIGCALCARVCPTNAIEARPYQRHEVKDELCVRCGACKTVCPRSAIVITPRHQHASRLATEAR